MNSFSILRWIILLGGIAIIVASFFLFGDKDTANIFYMNMGVTLLSFIIVHYNATSRWIDKGKNNDKSVGSLGLKLHVSMIYCIVAMAFVIIAKIVPLFSFSVQLIIHCVLLFAFLVGVMSAVAAGKQSESVAVEFEKKKEGKINLKKEFTSLNAKLCTMNNIDADVLEAINKLAEDVRFLAPSSNEEAVTLEKELIDEIQSIGFALSNYEMNKEEIKRRLKTAEFLFNNRKNIYN